MKKFNKILLLTFLSVLTLFQGCETIELENLKTPNALAPEDADPALLFNSVQLNYRNAVTTINNLGGELGRIEYMFGRVYFDNYPGLTLNGPWNNLYSAMIPDIENIENLNDEGSLDYLIGASKAMQAHVMMLMVDYLGDIVFTEANQPLDIPDPMLDDDQAVYEAALALLDEATTLMNDSSIGTAQDLYYNGSSEKWIKFINTLKMRAALTVGDYPAVVNATNVIEVADDNMAFSYGINEQEPDTRHPDYAADYTISGANNYRSNWLMHLMLGDLMISPSGVVSGDVDPRRRYYFYRQVEVTPGSDTYLFNIPNQTYFIYPDALGFTSENQANLQCSVQETPNHLQFTPDEDFWCSVRLGYWGRTHGNAEGIPPDNFLRTASGVYPAGGRFDDNLDYVIRRIENNEPVLDLYDAGVGLGLGAGGNGIEPIILSSFVEFWRAEAYFKLNNNGLAAQHFTAGVTESIDYVQTFGSRDGSADLSLAPSNAEVQEFIDNVTTAFTSAPNTTSVDSQGYPTTKDKLDILGEQFFIAMYGGGADAFNFIRRTGYPRTIARNIDSSPGPFPRTFLYPAVEVGANPNINQRQNNSTQVFWDSGVINPAN